MPDTTQDRTEPPTPRRRREAREQGQVARSADLGASVVLLAGLLALNYFGAPVFGRLLDIMRFCLGSRDPALLEPQAMPPLSVQAVLAVGYALLPFLLAITVAAVVAQGVQVGWFPTFRPLMPKLTRLNPGAGLKRLVSVRHLVQFGINLLKMTVVGAVVWHTLKDRYPVVVSAAALHHWGIVALLAELMFTLALRMAIVLLILGLIDYLYQRYRFERDLRMTKQEVKDELKSMEGDPKIKLKRRQLQIQLALQRMRAAVPKADVVVTNPTEIAVALKYDERTMAAPKVLAKGEGYLAAQIRRLAIEHGVPIIERPPLARALYRLVEVGQEIPSQFYQAVAEILAYVYEMAGKGYRRRPAAAGATV